MASSKVLRAAATYIECGWSPFPLAPREKFPPPIGVTGAAGVDVTSVEQFTRLRGGDKPGANLAVRMPRTVIGIDVDAYGSKDGAATWRAALERWGMPLSAAESGTGPGTWITTSRPDERVDGVMSGIRFYRIPAGLDWADRVGPGIEIIRWDHRYAVVAPSRHPEGRNYCWVGPNGLVSQELPEVEADLPELCAAAVEELTSGRREWINRPRLALDSSSVAKWLKKTGRDPDGDGRMCGPLLRTVEGGVAAIGNGLRGAAHDVARDSVYGILRDGAAGHAGLVAGLAELSRAFFDEVTAVGRSGRRTTEEAGREWTRIVEGGVRRVAAEGKVKKKDPCVRAREALVKKSAGGAGGRSVGSASPAEHDEELRTLAGRDGGPEYARNDHGNAERLVELMNGRFRWSGEEWFQVDERTSIWKPVDKEVVLDLAVLVGRAIYRESEILSEEDPKAAAKLRSWAVSSGNDGRIRAMVAVASRRPDIHAPELAAGDRFPDAIASGGWVLELRPELKKRIASPSDLLTLSATVDLVAAESGHGLWEKFLDRILPDLDSRDWIQRLAGYSMVGGNPERFVIFGIGPTSSGKTTFSNAIQAALGDYAAAAQPSIFIGRHDGPRPDLWAIMSRRIVFIEEASSDWKIHADAIKRVSGNAPLAVRTVFKEQATLPVLFTPWVMANSMPQIEGADPAVHRRLRLAPFPESISKEEEDPFIGRSLVNDPGCRAEVFEWLVEGWKKFQARGLKQAPRAVEYSLSGMKRELSDWDAFLAEVCIEEGTMSWGAMQKEAGSGLGSGGARLSDAVPAGILYEVYKLWAEENGMKAVSSTAFGRRMTERGHPSESRRVERDDEGVLGSPVRVRIGLQIRENWKNLIEGMQ